MQQLVDSLSLGGRCINFRDLMRRRQISSVSAQLLLNVPVYPSLASRKGSAAERQADSEASLSRKPPCRWIGRASAARSASSTHQISA